MRLYLAALLLAFFALVAPASAQTFPALSGRVVDQAHLLTPEQILNLTSKLQALEAQSGRQFVVATVSSLEGYPIEDYAYRLGRTWKLGSAKNNDGVLLLIAPNERKVWIATGYGAGIFLTDAMSGVIIRENILPHFKQSPPDYGGGIEAGADAIIKQMSLPPEEAQKNSRPGAAVSRSAAAFGRQCAASHFLGDGVRLCRSVALPAGPRPSLPNAFRRHQPVGRAVGP